MSGTDFEPSAPQPPQPVGDGSAPPEVVGFSEIAVEQEPLPTLALSSATATPPGPGLPESLGWTVLVLATQVFVLVILLGLVIVYLVSAHGGPVTAQFDLRQLGPNEFALLTGLPALFAYLMLIPLACWRISPSPLRKLNFSRPSLTQTVIIVSCVLPLGHISDALYVLQKDVWDRFLELFPALDGMQEMGLETTMTQLSGASLPMLLFLLAVVPAVGEEWMLRGLIGRGLIARWGVFPGVLFTSILFAAMHLDPPHVAAVFPLGVMMHLSYIATRSFWIPIGYHFLNNAIVSLFTSLGSAGIEETIEERSWLMPLAAIPYLAFAVAALWKLRTRYIGADGREPDPGYFSFEHYPESQARRVAPNHLLIGVVFGALLAGQVAREVWLAAAPDQGEGPTAGNAVETGGGPVVNTVESATAE